jgi:hypothetical protein
MNLRRINDWCLLAGADVEIRHHGAAVCSGTVDAVTEDGKILWLQSRVEGRRLFEKAEFYEAWACEERTGFHYRVTQCEPEPQNLTKRYAESRGADALAGAC